MTVPHSLDLERSIINAAIEWARVAPGVDPAHFYRRAHAIVWRAVVDALSRGLTPEYPVVRQILTERAQIDDVDPVYLNELARNGPRPTESMLMSCAQMLQNLHRERRKAEVLRIAADNPGAVDLEQFEQAIRALRTGDGHGPALPPLETLRTRLQRPPAPQEWRIVGLQPSHSRVLLGAQAKAGKTTLVTNFVRAYADHLPFLGFEVVPADGPIVVLDVEMSEHKLDDWYRDQGIRNDDRVIVIPMRGRTSEFNILDARVRSAWASHFRGVGARYLVGDCLRPILDALGMDEHKDAGQFLVQFDALLAEAEIPDAMLVHHFGHNGERSRGDSRIRDWPDVEWSLVNKADDSSTRFFKAYGRDVDVAEGQLSYDADSRRLGLVGGSRQDAEVDGVVTAIIDVLTKRGPLSGRAIKADLEGLHSKNVVDAALGRARATKKLNFEHGPRHSIVYSLPVSQCPASVPVDGRDSSVQCPAAFIRRDTGTLTDQPSSVPAGGTDALRF